MEFIMIKLLPYLIPTTIYIVTLYLVNTYYRKKYRPGNNVLKQYDDATPLVKPVINIVYDIGDDINQHVGDIAEIALNFRNIYFSENISSTANLPADNVFVEFSTINLNNILKISV
jgi:hypothetical protein